jgi:SARP family transcriptional regulator, regulator of embCAB operon
VEFGLSGTLTVRQDGVLKVSSAPKQRQLLALLLLNANEVVPVSERIEELWDHTPPNSAMVTLQTYVMHLRKGLGDPRAVPFRIHAGKTRSARGTAAGQLGA